MLVNMLCVHSHTCKVLSNVHIHTVVHANIQMYVGRGWSYIHCSISSVCVRDVIHVHVARCSEKWTQSTCRRGCIFVGSLRLQFMKRCVSNCSKCLVTEEAH